MSAQIPTVFFANGSNSFLPLWFIIILIPPDKIKILREESVYSKIKKQVNCLQKYACIRYNTYYKEVLT